MENCVICFMEPLSCSKNCIWQGRRAEKKNRKGIRIWRRDPL